MLSCFLDSLAISLTEIEIISCDILASLQNGSGIGVCYINHEFSFF